MPIETALVPFLQCDAKYEALAEEIIYVNERLRKFASDERLYYFDATEYLCSGGLCSTHNKGGKQLYYDRWHLSMDGSWLLGEEIYSQVGMPMVFRSMLSIIPAAEGGLAQVHHMMRACDDGIVGSKAKCGNK